MHPKLTLAPRLVILLGLLFLPLPPVSAQTGSVSNTTFGLLVEAQRAGELAAVARPSGSGAQPIVRLTARWDEIERVPGVFDWSLLDPEVSALSGAGYRVVLGLGGSNPLYLPAGGVPSPLAGESLDAWIAFVRSAARSFGGRVDVFEVGDAVGAPGTTGAPGYDPASYAFVLKNSALALRAEGRAAGFDLRVAQAPLATGGLDWQRRLWTEDVAAYVDVLPVRLDAQAGPRAVADQVRGLLREQLLRPPASPLWVYFSPGDDPWAGAAAAVAALAAGASGGFVAVEGGDARAAWTVAAQALLDGGFAPAPLGALRIEDDAGNEPSGGQVLGRFFSAEGFSSLVFFRLPALPQESVARLSLDSALVRNARIRDLVSGETRRVSVTAPASGGSGRVVAVSAAAAPQALLFQKAVGAIPDLPPEQVETLQTRDPTAEEIIARHQEVQRIQDDRLERWIARGRVDFHFKLAQGGSTVDVSIDSVYFWERGRGLEWEQTDYYINGNRIGWKNIPELPLIQPEKVVTLPLDLTLDKTYAYRLVGRARIDGREAWVLEFQPLDPDAPRSLYRGKVWIDRETFVRLQASVIQTGLDSPVLSNEEVDRFGPQRGPEDHPYWLLSSIDGQQIWKAAGRNFVVRRELSFREFQINPPRDTFEERRRQAYASSNQMLRDTDDGFRYLEARPDGTREVKQDVDSSQLFAAGGAFKDSSTDGVRPLGGVNYFDYDVAGRNIQMNAFFAGVLGVFTASKPDLFGSKLDATFDAALFGIKFEDKIFAEDRELLEQRLETRNQIFALQLGVPLGQFWKVNLRGGVSLRRFFENSEAADRIDDYNTSVPAPAERLEFVLPRNHRQFNGRVSLEFNRRGYTVTAGLNRGRRSAWEAWGLRGVDTGQTGFLDPRTDEFVPEEAEPLQKSFSRWSVTAFKEWYLPRFQKMRGEVNLLDGSDLDRFSRYQFSFFGDDRLNGFSGSGVLFDRARIARAGYSFNLFEAIRFDAALERARVEREGLPGSQSFTGLGLSGNVVGPWKTVINLNYGYALQSDIPDLEGEQEFLLVVLKLF